MYLLSFFRIVFLFCLRCCIRHIQDVQCYVRTVVNFVTFGATKSKFSRYSKKSRHFCMKHYCITVKCKIQFWTKKCLTDLHQKYCQHSVRPLLVVLETLTLLKIVVTHRYDLTKLNPSIRLHCAQFGYVYIHHLKSQ